MGRHALPRGGDTTAPVELFPLPPTLSHSQLTTWLQCGTKYAITKKYKIQESPAWFFIGGSAVHQATEEYDREHFEGRHVSENMILELFERELNSEIADALTVEPDMTKWRKGGRVSKDWPEKENEAWWRAKGPDMVRAYHEYRQTSRNVILELPDGSPAIELGYTVTLTPDAAPIKGAIDRVEVSPEGMVGVIDIKAGSSTPDTNLQLGGYAVALEALIGVRPTWGAYWKARDGKLTTPASLEMFTRKQIAREYAEFDRARKLGIFIPSRGWQCTNCGVKDFCPAQQGSRAHELFGDDI